MERRGGINEIIVDIVTGNVGGDPVTPERRINRDVRLHEPVPVESDVRLMSSEVDLDEKSVLCFCFTSRNVFRFGLSVYWAWTLVAIIGNSEIVFPALYIFPVIAFILAFIGASIRTFEFLMPIQLMVALDGLIALMEMFFLFSFRLEDNDLLKKFLEDKWYTKATQLKEINASYFEGYLIYLMLKFLYSAMMIVIIGQEMTKFRMLKHFEIQRSMLFRRANWIRERHRQVMNDGVPQNRGLELDSPFCLDTSVAGFLPPPRYESLVVLRTPEEGTPPPCYSTDERRRPDLGTTDGPKDTVSTDPSTAISLSSLV